MTLVRSIASASDRMLRVIYRYHRMLAAMTRVEMAKRHAGSILGMSWVVLQPALLLSVYVFVYMVVLRMRFEGFSRFDYVLYVFCGLVPYLGFMESVTTGALSIRQNIHLVKNVMLPIELIPVRSVLVGMTSQFVSIGLVIVMAAGDGALSWRFPLVLPVVALQLMWLIGLTWVLAGITVALPDITYFVNLFVFVLMFLSPIGYRPDMVPPAFAWVLRLNPIYYMTEMYRAVLLSSETVRLPILIGYVVMCLVTFGVGSAFFDRFRGVLTDYE